jgi:alkylation response protein AidB-like acyl-CoA dehydrogenase
MTVDSSPDDATLAQRYLPDELLARMRERAEAYDRENRFCEEDLAELRERGYLTAMVPEDLGGAGLNLGQVARLQQRLAGASPATALAVNMHLMTLGVVRVMAQRGDHSLDYVAAEAMAGEIFAFGVSEPGNDWVLQGSNTTAARQPDGGYLLTGVKIFTSLSPVWTRLLVHGLDESDPENPVVVYGFIARTDAVRPGENWDVLGMRATESRATVLTDAPLRADRIARTIPAGRTPDLLTFGITANFQLLIASVYAGIAARALDLAAAGLKARRSARQQTSYAQIPEYRVRIADAYRDFLPVTAQIDCYTRDVDELVDHGAGWPLRLVSARIVASVAARSSRFSIEPNF